MVDSYESRSTAVCVRVTHTARPAALLDGDVCGDRRRLASVIKMVTDPHAERALGRAALDVWNPTRPCVAASILAPRVPAIASGGLDLARLHVLPSDQAQVVALE